MILIFPINSHQRHLFHIIPGSSPWPFITSFLILYIDVISRIWLVVNSGIKEAVEKAKKDVEESIKRFEQSVGEAEIIEEAISEGLERSKELVKEALDLISEVKKTEKLKKAGILLKEALEAMENTKKSIPSIIFSIDLTVGELEKSVKNIKEVLKKL